MNTDRIAEYIAVGILSNFTKIKDTEHEKISRINQKRI